MRESNDLKSKKTLSYNTHNKGKAIENSKIKLAFLCVCVCERFSFFGRGDFWEIQV